MATPTENNSESPTTFNADLWPLETRSGPVKVSSFEEYRELLAIHPYRPLDMKSEEIRILHLQPSRSYDDEVVVELNVVSLLEKPVYEIISYCWGEVSGYDSIWIDDVKIRVPASATKVLRQFRYSHIDRYLWLDAVCINQLDFDERAQQVVLMAQIYGNTLRCLIWLGDADETVEEAVRTAQVLAKWAWEEKQKLEDADDDVVEAHYAEKFRMIDEHLVGVTLPHDCDEYALVSLLERPWFSRLWVLQEAVLAKEPICICGRWAVSWHALCAATGYLRANFRLGDESLCPAAVCQTIIFDMMVSSRKRDSDVRGIQLGPLLIHTRELNASDPKDKVYGVLGLTQWGAPGEKPPDLLTVDYAKALRELLRDATRAAVIHSGTLMILEAIDEIKIKAGQEPCSDEKWPSWTPRLHQREAAAPMKFLDHQVCTRIKVEVDLLVDVEERDCLALLGYELDRVASVVDILSRPDARIGGLTEAKPLERYFPFMGFLMTNGKQDLIGPALLALTDGYLLEYLDEPRKMSFAEFVGKFIEIMAEGKSLTEIELGEDFVAILRLLNFRSMMFDGSTGERLRRLFLTAKGRIGFGPEAIQNDDRVVALFGGRNAFVLRRVVLQHPRRHIVEEKTQLDHGSDEEECLQFRIVGQSYVHGIMEGQAVAALIAAGEEPVLFNIW